jgi:hypothetical protein
VFVSLLVGMRMHGKMHIDNGEEFSDEHMVEIEEPPLVPVIFNNPIETASTNVEAELIRLKNEPYKRRRSRKSYEKSEHMGNIRTVFPLYPHRVQRYALLGM